MHVPTARGPISALVRSWLTGVTQPDVAVAEKMCAAACDDPIDDEDRQVALWMLYELHYGGFVDVDDTWEWSPATIHVRGLLERDFEAALRAMAASLATRLVDSDRDLSQHFFDVVGSLESPPLTAYLQRRATSEQMREFLIHRTIYHLKEADPHSWAIPRLTGQAKVALVELQYDEYGAGQPERQHAELFKRTLEACDLDSEYGVYFDQVPAVVLAVNNAMSLFGLHRRLRAAAMGHLAAFESTSSLPARRISRGLERLGFPVVAAEYYDEHVEADAVHEQIAVRVICGALVAEDPRHLADVALGAAACLLLDDRAAQYLLDRWETGRSGLRGADHAGVLVSA
jgi:pyrroloquinoline quinone (PQQ) biosynthesis protein C